MTRRWAPGARALPELALAVAALIAVARLTGSGAGLVALVASWLPFDPGSIDPLDTATAAFALGALAAGVRRRKRLAWPLAVLLFGAALVAQALVLRHPIGAAVAVVCLAVLLADARRFRTRTDQRMRRLAIGIMGAGVVVLVGGSILVAVSAGGPLGGLLDQLSTWAIEVLDFLDPTGFVQLARSAEVLEAVEFLVGAAVLVAAMAMLAADPDRPSPGLLDRDRSIARRLASGSLAPFQVGPDTLFYAEPSGRGIVAYGRTGRTAVVLGDPIGPSVAGWRAFRAFEARCAAGDVAVSVYQASPATAEGLAERGYRVFRVGDEAVLGLPGWTLEGPRHANLRHTVVRAGRGGVEVAWRPDGLHPADWVRWGDQLVAVDRAWQAEHGPGMRFTISTFDPEALRGAAAAASGPAGLAPVAIAVAVDRNDRVEAFATFRRTEPDGWVLDLLRRRHGGVPGALEACISSAATAMREAGDLELSLGLVALSGLSARRGPIEERLLAVGRAGIGRAYDVAGLRFFKAKFDPEWRPRFGAVQGTFGIVAYLIALLSLHLSVGSAGSPGGRSLPASLGRRLRRREPAGAAGSTGGAGGP